MVDRTCIQRIQHYILHPKFQALGLTMTEFVIKDEDLVGLKDQVVVVTGTSS